MLLCVAPIALNLRSAPRVSPDNRIAVLPQGQLVSVRGLCSPPWRRIRTTIAGASLEGFVHGGYLKETVTGARSFEAVVPVHLEQGRPDAAPRSARARAFPVGDPDRPSIAPSSSPARRSGLLRIAEYLQVEKSPRYAPRGAATFCNVYAYDFCYLAGAYLPRVWWTGPALERLARGEAVEPLYDRTVRELRANDLYDWFVDYGERFAWKRCFDLNRLQERANAGSVGIVVAQRGERARPGHISVVVPEHEAHACARASGRVLRPLQSQAGRINRKYSAGRRAWWADARFRAFGFWTAD